MKPGQKVYHKCEKKCQENPDKSTESFEVDEYEDATISKDFFNESAQLLGVSPLKSVIKRDKPSYGKRKLMDIETAAKTHISKVLKIQQDTFTCTKKIECEKCRDCMVLLDQMKEKCKKVSRKEKIKLSTLVPDSWTIQRTMD